MIRVFGTTLPENSGLAPENGADSILRTHRTLSGIILIVVPFCAAASKSSVAFDCPDRETLKRAKKAPRTPIQKHHRKELLSRTLRALTHPERARTVRRMKPAGSRLAASAPPRGTKISLERSAVGRGHDSLPTDFDACH